MMTQVIWLFVLVLISLQSALSETRHVVGWNEDLPSDNPPKEDLLLDNSSKEELPSDNLPKEDLALDNSSKEDLPSDKSSREDLPLDNSAKVRKENVDISSQSKTLLKENEDKSSSAVRTRKDAQGGQTVVECYKTYEPSSTDKFVGSCGVRYQYGKKADGSVDCTGSATDLRPFNGADIEIAAGHTLFGTDKFANKDVYTIICACGAARCNEKGHAWDCIENAIRYENYKKSSEVTEENLNQLVRCITGSENFTDVVNRYTTTTTSTTTTTTTTTSTVTTTTTTSPTTPSAAVPHEKSDYMVFIITGSICGVLVIVIIVLAVIVIKKKSGKEKQAAGDRTVQDKSGETPKSNNTTPVAAGGGKGKGKSAERASGSKEKTASTTPTSKTPPAPSLLEEHKATTPKPTTALLATCRVLLGMSLTKLTIEYNKAREDTIENKIPTLNHIAPAFCRFKGVSTNAEWMARVAWDGPIMEEYFSVNSLAPMYAACFVDEERTLIVGEGPGKCNIDEFLLVCYMHNVSTILSIGEEDDVNKSKFKKFVLGEGEKAMFGIFMVAVLKQKFLSENIVVSEVELSIKGTRGKRFVHIHHKEWKDHENPDSPENTVKVVEYIQNNQSHRITPKSPMFIHCSSGAGRSCSMAMLHLMITAGHSNKPIIDYIGIFTRILCARIGGITRGGCILFVLNAFLEYALKLKVLKDDDLTKWRVDLEKFIPMVMCQDAEKGAITKTSTNPEQ